MRKIPEYGLGRNEVANKHAAVMNGVAAPMKHFR
jgi:hypothetical protein